MHEPPGRGPRHRSAAAAARLRVALAAALVVTLAGCSDRDYYKNPPMEESPLVAEAPRGLNPVVLHEGVTEPVSTSAPLVPTTREITMDPRRPKDKTDKADIYWKLKWLVGAGGAARADGELRTAIKRTVDDPAEELIVRILGLLDDACDAYDARGITPDGLVSNSALPWGAPAADFDESLSDDDDPGVDDSDASRKSKKLAAFNARFHMSPETVRASSISEAKVAVEQLKQMLDSERKLDGDHPIGPGPEEAASGIPLSPLPGGTALDAPIIPPP